MAAPLMYERIYDFQLRKIAGHDMEISCLRLDCILPVELKNSHQLFLRGQYTDLGNTERSSCGGDQTLGNNHSRKRRFPVLLKHVEYKSHREMRYPL